MSIIVTAASGRLGALVVEALLARDVSPSDVIATSRDITRLDDLAAQGVTVARVDYSDPATVTDTVKSGDVLILISGTEIGQRFAQHAAVITAAKDAGVGRIIYTSVPHAPTSTLRIAPEHAQTEEYLITAGIPFTILRNGWYTENYVGEIATARGTGVIATSAGDGRVASASRRDYAEAAAAAALDLSLEGRTLELSGDYAWNWDDLAKALSGIVGRHVTVDYLSAQDYADRLEAVGVSAAAIASMIALNDDIRAGELRETTKELSRLIGHPTETLSGGLAAIA